MRVHGRSNVLAWQLVAVLLAAVDVGVGAAVVKARKDETA